MKTIVYIDALNLFYGALKGTPLKWLDLNKLCTLLLPKSDIKHIHYCTAQILARANDPQKPQRQQIYLRALETLPNLTITYGHFLTSEIMMPVAKPAAGQPKYIKVTKTEEKGSDVNLAALMLRDGYSNAYDLAVLVSNDSDLALPLEIIRNDLNKKVGILNPYKRPSQTLLKHTDFIKPIRTGVLNASQFPSQLKDKQGSFRKPKDW